MKCLLILFLFVISFSLLAQNLSDNSIALDLATRSLDKMYNFENVESKSLADKLEEVLPGHPASTFLHFLNYYWNSAPGGPDDNKFQFYLRETLARADKLLDKDKNNEEGIFFKLAAHGYLSQYYAEENSNLKALKEAKNAYSFMKTGFNLLDKSSDFYYTTGLYNYYREQFPESHPVYKPFMWVFANGDKAKGIKQLEKASKEALFTKTEALHYVSNIYLHYEKMPAKAEQFAAKLVRKYPGNHFYRSLYVEILLDLGKFSEADYHIQHLKSTNLPYYNFVGSTFMAIQIEKQQNNIKEAKTLYKKVIDDSRSIKLNVNHYLSMAYNGMGRISLIEGDRKKAKEYFKKVLDLAHYPSVREEAEKGLKET